MSLRTSDFIGSLEVSATAFVGTASVPTYGSIFQATLALNIDYIWANGLFIRKVGFMREYMIAPILNGRLRLELLAKINQPSVSHASTRGQPVAHPTWLRDAINAGFVCGDGEAIFMSTRKVCFSSNSSVKHPFHMG